MIMPETMIGQTVDGQRFHLSAWHRDTGSDLTVFVHGLACSKHSFAQAWQSEDFRDQSLLALDLPGFGRSSRPENFSHDLEQQGRILAALIDQHASRRIHLVAHSLGGTIAVLIPRRSLARLQSLVLVEARLMRESCGITAKISAMSFAQFEQQFLPEYKASLSPARRALFDLDRADPVAFYRSACSLMHWVDTQELPARLLAAPCETAFVYAETCRCQAELAALRDIEQVFIPDAGHFIPVENPGVFYDRLCRIQSRSGNCDRGS